MTLHPCKHCGHEKTLHTATAPSPLNEKAIVEGACWYGFTNSKDKGWHWPEDCKCPGYEEVEKSV